MHRLFVAWLTFWSTYFSISGLFDNKVSQPKNKLTNRDIYRQLLKHVIITFIVTYIATYIKFRGIRIGMIPKILLSMIMNEIWFYYSHRLMHTKLWKYHKQHHYFYHPSAVSSLYVSVVELILVNYPNILLPLTVFDFTNTETVIFSLGAALFLLTGHNSNGKLWLTTSNHHLIHHKDYNHNYGFLHIMDYIHGTHKIN